MAVRDSGSACELQHFIAEKKTGEQGSTLWTCAGSGLVVFYKWVSFATCAFAYLFVGFWYFSFSYLCRINAENLMQLRN